MTYLIPRSLLSDALPELPPTELSRRFGGSVIDARGREVPITEEMVNRALQAFQHPAQQSSGMQAGSPVK